MPTLPPAQARRAPPPAPVRDPARRGVPPVSTASGPGSSRPASTWWVRSAAGVAACRCCPTCCASAAYGFTRGGRDLARRMTAMPHSTPPEVASTDERNGTSTFEISTPTTATSAPMPASNRQVRREGSITFALQHSSRPCGALDTACDLGGRGLVGRRVLRSASSGDCRRRVPLRLPGVAR